MTQLPNQNLQFITETVTKSMKNSVGTQNSSFYQIMDGDYIIEDYNIFRDRYYHQIIHMTQWYNLSDTDFMKYKYRPKRLSADLFGSIDYWYIILMINNMNSIMEFRKRRIKVPTLGCIDYIKQILKKEESNILANKHAIQDEMKS